MGQISAAAFNPYDPSQASSITPGPLALYTVQAGSIDPTQENEGYAEVGKKTAGFDLDNAAQLQASLLASIEPVVIGPGGQLYLTDGHHTFTALDDSIYGPSTLVYVNVIANYSNLTTAQFFAQMQADNFLLPLDNGVPQTVNDATGAPIPTSLTALTNDPYRGLEYGILKNKNSKLFTSSSNITGATGTSTPGLDKMTGFYSDFLEAAAYRSANGGLGLSYLSAGDIALSSQWNLNGASTFTLPNITGTVTAAQLPGFILAQNLVQGGNVAPTVISNATLANGAIDGNGTFTGVTTINAGTAANPITIGTPNTGFIMQLGADRGFSVTLNGANTYTGGTSILAGTLIVTSDAALGAAATGATIDTTNLKTSVQAANGIVFNSLSEGNGTLQIGTSSGGGTSTFTTSRVIAVGSEAATINLNGYLVSLTGALYSLGTANVGIGNATGFSDLTIDDNSANKGVLTLSTASPNFYGNIIIGLNNKPTVRVMSDAALGATSGNANAIGQVELNGGTLQAGASFTASERNIFLASGSTIDLAGFATSWGTLSDTQRVLTIANSSSTAATGVFANFTIASMASLVLTNTETVTFANGFVRSGTAGAIIQAASLGSTQKLMSGSTVSLVDGVAQAWIVTNNGTGSSAGPYDFVTYGANGYVKATYGSTTLSGTTGTSTVALGAATTASGNVAAYALNTEGKVITLGSNTLTIGDGTSTDAAGLILASGSSIVGGTLAFGGSEGVIWLSGSNPTISSQITGSGGLTFSGSGSVALNAAASLSGIVTINSGTITLGAVNVFATDTAGVLLQDTKSTPAKAALAVTANNTLAALSSAGNNSAITIATGITLTIGDTTNNLSSTLSSTITGSGSATIVKAGSGLLDLSAGKVTSIGTISATGGALRVAVGTSATVNYALSNGADLQFAQNGGGQYSGAISGAGTLHLIGGTLQLTGTANTYSGGTIVETGSTLDLTTANVSTTNANITDAGGLILFDQATSGTFSGVISDGQELGTGPTLQGSLDKDDSTGANAGNLTLSAVQTYTGATYDEAGTLTLGAANAIASSSGLTLGRVGGGATATLALGANEMLSSLSSNASNTTSVTLNGFALTVAPGAGVSSTFGGAIGDGTAAGSLVKSGAGTLVLSGASTYTGGTSLNAGALDLTTATAAGTGPITFGTGSQTLDIEKAALNGNGSFGDTLASFGVGDSIDLRGIGTATGATFNAANDVLTVTGGSETVNLQLDASAQPAAGYGYVVSSDNNPGSSGTLISMAQVQPTTVAGGYQISALEGQTVSGNPPGALTGDSANGGTLSITAVTSPSGSTAVPSDPDTSTTISETYGDITLFSTGAYFYSADNTTAIDAAAAGSSPVDSFDFTVANGSATAQESFSVTIERPPSINAGGTASYTEGGTASSIDSGLTVADPDGNMITGATVTESSGYFAGDTLNFTAQNGITGIFSGQTLTLNGSATAANYQTALESITFSSTSQNPDDYGTDTSRTVSFQVSDANATSSTATSTVDITAVNNPPVLGGGANTVGYTQGQASSQTIDSGLTVSDPDNTNLAGATVTIAGGTFFSGDVLSVNLGTTGGTYNGTNITGTYDGAGTLTLSGSDTLADYETVLDAVQFSTTSQNPTDYGTDNSRTIDFVANDGSASNNLSNTAASTVDITAVDQTPTLVVQSSTMEAVQGSAAVPAESSVSVGDLDNTTLASAAVSISAGAQAGDELGINGSQSGSIVNGGNTITYNFSGTTLALTGTDTLADYQAALAEVTYQDTGTDTTTVGHPTRSFSFTVNDGTKTSSAANTTLTIDRPPSATAETGSVLAGRTLTGAGGAALAGDTDADGDTLSISSVTSGTTTDSIASGSPATITGTYGSLTLNADGSYSYTASNGLAIVTAADGSPIVDSFSIGVSDGNGGVSASSLAVTISLAAGGTETVTNPTGSATYSIGATTLTFNETSASTYGGVIQDGSSGNTGGNVVVSGSAPLTLTGVSTYTGKTSVSGTLALSGTGSVYSSTKVALTASGATFDISGATATEVVNKLGGVTGTVADLGGQNLKIKVQSGTVDLFSGTIQDGGISSGTGGSLTLGGTGELNLTAAESYTGATTLDAGTLALTGSGSIATSSGLSLQNSLGFNATFDMSGETATSVGSLSGVAGSLIDLGAGTLTVNEAAATTFAGVIADGGLSGGAGGNLAVAGSAALTLTGVSTYTGKTSVSGTLDLSGSASIHSSTKVALTTSGATLDISGATGGEVINKLGGVAGTVTDLGNQNLKIKVQSGTVDTYAGTIKDGGVNGGSGGSVTLGGLGELSLTAANSYTGGTEIDAGTLDLAASGAAGSGTITFANPSSNGVATLEIDAAALSGSNGIYSFGNAIAGATSTNQMIDLRSLSYVQGSTSATLVGTTLNVNDGSSDVTLQLAAAQAKSSFTTASDGHGGTLVYDPPATKTRAAATAKIDTSWIEAAMADFGGVGDHLHHMPIHDPYGAGSLGASSAHGHHSDTHAFGRVG